MAQFLGNNLVKLNSGKTVQAQQGGWYDGQQFWANTLSDPGQINQYSNQLGAGQAVSSEVIAQTAPENVQYIEQRRQDQQLPPPPSVQQPQPQATNQAQTNNQMAVQPAQSISQGITSIEPQGINLPKLYESLYESSGIRDIEAGLADKTKAYNEQIAKIKDNPYLAEATMTGRVKKLEEKYNADMKAVQDQIATKKADIETQLNLASKQFDIESQQAEQSLSQFNTLLNIGALDNASGEDIANFTRATGIPSSMIYSAITESKRSKDEKKNTSLIQSTNDAGIVTVSLIDTDTGDIIKQQSLGAIGNQQGSTKLTQTEKKDNELSQNIEAVKVSAQNYNNLQDIINTFAISGSGLSVEDVYRIYSQNSPFGKPKETLEQIKKGIFVDKSGELPDENSITFAL